ncbi:MAG: alkaline phytoceramidase [Gammaproteobacteria bacterium]|nr:alkaline phytoceramidase [Gammaproteobacteria bacterium]
MTLLEELLRPLAQDPAYHAFADGRSMLGIPNFWNVVSSLPFLVIGVWGLVFLARNPGTAARLRAAWAVFFVGIVATAFGSGYYHLAPDNASLGWDRLAMVVAFMGLLAIAVGEYLSPAWANRLLVPLLLAGLGSVGYWLDSEARGAGDLRPYALIQFLPMLLVPALVLLRRGRSDLGPYFGLLIVFYAAAKIFEFYDAPVFAAGELMSGHAIKHVLAALGAASLLLGLGRRRLAGPPG